MLRSAERLNDAWWLRKQSELHDIAKVHPNAYVYDLDSLKSAAAKLLALKSVKRVLYAVKANFNPAIIRTLAAAGINFDCV